jgi:hypothetical protein
MKRNLRLPLLLIALIIAAAGVAISYAQRINQPLPPSLDRLLEARLVEIKDDAGQVVLSGELSTVSDAKNEIERVATLAGAGAAKGEAEIELVKSGNAFSKQELEVALEGLAKTSSFKLFVDGAEIITFTTNKSGKAAMKFSSKNSKK